MASSILFCPLFIPTHILRHEYMQSLKFHLHQGEYRMECNQRP